MNKAEHWLAPAWPAPSNIHAATTLRTGGVSRGAYASLNLALHVGDNEDSVKKNRQMIKVMLDLPAEPVWLHQIHSNVAVNAVESASLQPADASYTCEPGIVCAVMTADCLPLLVCDAAGTQIAAIHAGWRGLLAGIIGNTINAMQSPLGKRQARRDLLVWLGPAIAPECFEVGAEVHKAFVEKSAEFITAFKKQNNGKWLADIYQLARIELAALGIIENVYGGNFCTVTERERFYSYRRETQTGRMATLIWRE
ncbi:MAG: peptidoglycan editing factor PgeF [Methylobacter sp.]